MNRLHRLSARSNKKSDKSEQSVERKNRGSTLTADRVLPLFAQALQRPTEYLLQRRKYAHGRQSTSAICASIVTADKVPDDAGWNTLTADGIPDATGWNTLSAVRVLATTAEILSRPT